MTRRSVLTRAAACLALGLVTTVAVAWGFAVRGHGTNAAPVRFVVFAPAEGYGAGALMPSERVWAGSRMRLIHGPTPAKVPSHIDGLVERPIAAFGRGWGLSYEACRAWQARTGFGNLVQHAFGWPRPALWYEGEQTPTAARVGGIPLPRALSGPKVRGNIYGTRALPWRPIWGGLTLDTAVYAAAWAVPLFGWPVLRARRRRRRGLCVACGYDLGGNFEAGCPECGWGKE